jgi:hypothetical protein
LQDGGVLRLHLGASDYFAFQVPAASPAGHYVDPSPQAHQTLTAANNCKVTLGAGNLATLGASGGTVGDFADSLGVKSTSEGNGQSCGRMDTLTQILGLGLGSASTMSDKLIDFAEIDIEGKFNANLQIKGYAVDGGACPPSNDTNLVKTENYNLTAGSDSGPDSGDGDNYRLRFPKFGLDGSGNASVPTFTAVDCLTFKATSGGTSLEGGSDGTKAICLDPLEHCTTSLGQTIDDTTAGAATNTSDSLFHLIEADGVLTCTDNGSNGVTQGGDGTPETTLERFDNVSGPCVPIPYDQDSSVSDGGSCNPADPTFAQCIFFFKDLLGQQAQFVWTVTWEPEPGTYQESATQFDFGAGFHDISLCDPDNGDTDTLPQLSGDDPFCVFDTHTVLVGGDPGAPMVQVTEKYYGVNDPGGARH